MKRNLIYKHKFAIKHIESELFIGNRMKDNLPILTNLLPETLIFDEWVFAFEASESFNRLYVRYYGKQIRMFIVQVDIVDNKVFQRVINSKQM